MSDEIKYKSPKISVIVPVYNVENYLTKCIDSILSQTFIDYELLLINDGSTDSSGAICDRYADIDKRIKVIHQINSGVSLTRNKGLNEARGEYISFIDADDWIDTTTYEEVLSYTLNFNSEVTLFGYKIINCNNIILVPVLGEIGELNSKDKYKLISSIIGKKEFASQIQMGSIWNILFKRKIITALRFKQIRFAEDKLFLLELLIIANHISVYPKCLYNYRTNINSATRKYFESLYIDMIINQNYLSDLLFKYKLNKTFESEIKNNSLHFLLALFYNEAKSRRKINNSVSKISTFYNELNIFQTLSWSKTITYSLRQPIWFLAKLKLFRGCILIAKLRYYILNEFRI